MKTYLTKHKQNNKVSSLFLCVFVKTIIKKIKRTPQQTGYSNVYTFITVLLKHYNINVSKLN